MNSLWNNPLAPEGYLHASTPDGYEWSPSPTQPQDDCDVPSSPQVDPMPLDTPVQEHRHGIDPRIPNHQAGLGRHGMWKEYHLHLTGTQLLLGNRQLTDFTLNSTVHGCGWQYLASQYPSHSTTYTCTWWLYSIRAPNSIPVGWFPLQTRRDVSTQYHYLLDLWDADMKRHGTSNPFQSFWDVYDTINAIQDGIAPWQCYTISSNPGGALNVDDQPSWMKQKYEVWCHDPDTVIWNILDNPDFVSHFDTIPYIARDHEGKRRWTDFMSGQFAWQRSVSSIVESYEGVVFMLFRQWFIMTIWLHKVPTRQLCPSQQAMWNTIRYTSWLGIFTT